MDFAASGVTPRHEVHRVVSYLYTGDLVTKVGVILIVPTALLFVQPESLATHSILQV